MCMTGIEYEKYTLPFSFTINSLTGHAILHILYTVNLMGKY